MKKIGKRTIRFGHGVNVLGYEAVVGEKEKKGPMGHHFKNYSLDEYFGQDSYEKAEAYMQKEAIKGVLENTKTNPENIDFIFAGDLLNQCVGSNYCIRDFNMQFFGVYGACSTMAETLILASMAIDGDFADKTLAVTSSHFCSAERQFRFPLEYGSQRTPSAQWTVTGAGCVLLGKDGGSIQIKHACPGIVCDMGINDISNMGSAMAPAAAATYSAFFKDTNTKPSDYDLILTGDLGSIGHEILIELMREEGFEMGPMYLDCGMMIFDKKKQDVHAGGSGCGCSASVLTGYILPMMENSTYKNVLFTATGALMSPTVNLQGETIPGIAHLLHLKKV